MTEQLCHKGTLVNCALFDSFAMNIKLKKKKIKKPNSLPRIAAKSYYLLPLFGLLPPVFGEREAKNAMWGSWAGDDRNCSCSGVNV